MERSRHRSNGLILTQHAFDVPVDHTGTGSERIEVFAREVAAPGGEGRPYLVFFQGGPGFESPRPTSKNSPLWLDRALRDFRVLLLDQRGTGLSTAATHETLAGLDAQAQAEYLSHFRADSIVRDAELIRAELDSPPWTVLGQSFGGFCVTCYLSRAPEGLCRALITGGLPRLEGGADEVYRATYRRVLDRSLVHYERYPEDRDRARRLVERLRDEDVRLPGGDRLTVGRFRALGHMLGMSDGSPNLHYLLELPLGYAFLHDVEADDGFARNPIYALLHEAEYSDGPPTRWSAERILAEQAEFEDETILFGEMVFPWMFEDYGALAPLRDAALLLAGRDGWPPLYDADRLRANEVPTAAAVYANDMYVERRFSEETARTIRGAQVWLTNEYEHNGLRVDGSRILDRLLELSA